MDRSDHRPARPPARTAVIAILIGTLLAGIGLPGAGLSAAPAPEARLAPVVPDGVAVDTGPLSVPSDGSFRIGVEVEVPEPTSYLEIRLQIRRPAGRLLFQRTEVRSDVETGTVDVEFSRELADLQLRPDAYPYEVRVRAQTDEVVEKVATGHLLVHAPDTPVVPVALAARISSVPRFDAQGRFVSDPARSTTSLEQAEALARAVLDDPELRLALAIAPVTLDEWTRISQGFLLSEPDVGLVEVDAEEPAPARYAAALQLLRDAVATGRLELLDVPYADPDIAALASAGRLGDLTAHYAKGLSTYLATLETSPTAGTVIADDMLPAAAIAELEERGQRFVVLAPGALVPPDPALDTPDGVRRLDGSRITALVLNDEIREALEAGATSAATHLVFHRAASGSDEAVVALADLGPGRPASVESVVELATAVREAAWAELTYPSAIAGRASGDVLALPESIESTPSAPAGYWDEVAGAREYAAALEASAGIGDPDVRDATEASLIAQSSRWAGFDGSWSMADRGRSFAAHADRISRGVLDEVTVTAKNVTLAGPRGDVPISVTNGSPKDLAVTVRVSASDLTLVSDAEELVTLRPQENFHTIGVDLKSALAGTLVVEVWAGELMLASESSVVRASYLDRLAVVGGIALLLLGLLLFIRKRVRDADAGKMPRAGGTPTGEDESS